MVRVLQGVLVRVVDWVEELFDDLLRHNDTLLHKFLRLGVAGTFLTPGVLGVQPRNLLGALARVDLDHQIVDRLMYIGTNPVEFAFDSLRFQKVWPLDKGPIVEDHETRVGARSFYLVFE